MAKVTILGRGLEPGEIESLQVLLAKAGACTEPAQVLNTISEMPPDDDDAIVVLLGTSATCLDGELEADLVRTQASAQRAIWVWPEESSELQLPPAAKKYCYSIVPWNTKKISKAVADDDVTCFEMPNGTPIAKVDTERNICVDIDKVKSK